MPSFICGTNRNNYGIGNVELESLMHTKECAAMWEYPPDSGTQVSHLSHMQAVDVGDLIFMFASGGIVIGVGKATGGAIGPIAPGNARDCAD